MTEHPMIFPYATPESQGVDSRAILNALDNAALRARRGAELHDMLILRHGKLVYEGYTYPFNAQTKHAVFSQTKSFTATAVGLCIEDGLLSLDDTLLSFYPDYTPKHMSDFKRRLCVKHLLAMADGQDYDAMDLFFGKGDGVKRFLDLPVKFEPGTHHHYNTGSSHMLSILVQKVTGKTVYALLKERVFDKIGITITEKDWLMIKGVCSGGFGLHATAMDVLRLANLYLLNGKWNNEQILSQSWVKAVSTKQVSNNRGEGQNLMPSWNAGYNYQFWTCDYLDAYRIDGMGAQQAAIIPCKDAVVLLNAAVCGEDSEYMQVLARHFIVPALEDKPLPENPAALAALLARRDALAAPGARPAVPVAQALLGSYTCIDAPLFPVDGMTLAQDEEWLTLTLGLGGKNVDLRFRLDGVPFVSNTATPLSQMGKNFNCRIEEAGDTLHLAFTAFPSVQRVDLCFTQRDADTLLLTPTFRYCGSAMDEGLSGKEIMLKRK